MFLNVIDLALDKPLDETPWAAGYHAELWFGPDANTLGSQSYSSYNGTANQADPSSFFVRELARTFPGASLDSILSAVRALQRGEVYVSPAVSQQLVRTLRRGLPRGAADLTAEAKRLE